MARYTGPDCKRCRREKMKLFLKGAKCETPKCPIEIRPYPPGEHGRGRTKDSEYLLQKREKQKCARIYGILEKQFRGYYDEANRRSGKTGDELLRILESRLDNVVYRAQFASSRDAARQIVRHGHVLVNGKRVNIASYTVKPGDVVSVRERSRNMALVLEALQSGERDHPEYLTYEAKGMAVTFVRIPELAEVPYPVKMEPNLVIEFYSS